MNPSPEHPGLEALSEALDTSFRAFRVLLLVLAAAYLASGIFVVRQHERAFVLVFGKIHGLGAERVREPGLHWTWPRPFAEVVRTPAGRVQTLDTASFWRRTEPDLQEHDAAAAGPTLDPARDGYVLTGDANILHAKWAARFTLSDPEAHEFGFADAAGLFRAEMDRAIVRVTARFAADRALRTDIASVRDVVESELIRSCAERGLGVRVQGLDLTSVAPPAQVAAAFDRVVQAEQDRARAISEARAYAARTMNEGRGEAAKRVAEGETYKKRLLAEIGADADAFRKVFAQYTRNPAVFKQAMVQDVLRRALPNVEQKYVVHGSRDGRQEIRLQLGPERRPMEGE